MSDAPRRRRSQDDEGGGGGGGFPLFPLVLAVVIGGLLLGGLLARFTNGSHNASPAATAPPSAIPVAVATPPSFAPPVKQKPIAGASRSPAPASSPSSKPSVAPAPSATASSRPTSAPTASAKPAAPHPAVTPRSGPVVIITPAPHRTAASATAAASTPQPASAATNAPGAYGNTSTDAASGIVRAYLGALARGDRATATSYLLNGLPNEAFMDSSARVLSVRSDPIGKGSYKAAADVRTASGEYYITFTLSPGPGGLQIGDHYAIKIGP